MNTLIQIFLGTDLGRSLIVDGTPVATLTLDFAISMDSAHVQILAITETPILHAPKKFQIQLSNTGNPQHLVDLILLNFFQENSRDLYLTTPDQYERKKLTEFIQMLAAKL